ncbi:glycosyltransferase [Mesoflavibacter sp. CH_XMU1404-2]|uniref:glycosyltransferase family 2 protein n=1 Tax=Mesoflavibacter sp. CH_XMU1404-2 TaxID=3107766 RepID=UPI00300B0708
MSLPVVSIVVTTYNHQDYIKQCLDSILMQKTNFAYEIILGEDESSDGTRETCQDYANRFPDIIKLFLRSRKDVIYINDRPTGRYNFIESLKSAKGKYIALCEGDDYWTDPDKLQKQVDFLEQHKQYGLCSHNAEEIDFKKPEEKIIIPNTNLDLKIEDFIRANRLATCLIMFRKDSFKFGLSWFEKIPFGDLCVILNVLKNTNQKAKVLNDTMAVYRIHSSGIHGSLKSNNTKLIKAYLQHIKFFKIIKKELLFEQIFQKPIYNKLIKTYSILMSLSLKEKKKIMYFKFRFLEVYFKIIKKIKYV